MAKSLEKEILDRVLGDDYLSGNYEYSLSSFERWFYRLKLIVCILLGLYDPNPSEDGLTVMQVEYRSWYFGWNAQFASVGLGVFKNWHYTFYSDGDSWI